MEQTKKVDKEDMEADILLNKIKNILNEK